MDRLITWKIKKTTRYIVPSAVTNEFDLDSYCKKPLFIDGSKKRFGYWYQYIKTVEIERNCRKYDPTSDFFS